MLELNFEIKGVSPISFSRAIQSVKDTGETHDVFEERTWRERMHVDEQGKVFIPPSAIKNMLSDCAKYLSESVPGKGKSTYTKHFEAGILVVDPVKLGVDSAKVAGERLHVPSDGRRGGARRVWKTFPVLPTWSGVCRVYLLDPVLIAKPEKVEEYMGYAGQFIGLGRFRPRNSGFYGRFEVKRIN